MAEKIKYQTGFGQVEKLLIQRSPEAGHFFLFDHGLLDPQGGRKIVYGFLVLRVEFFGFLVPHNKLFQVLPLIQGSRSSFPCGSVHFLVNQIQQDLGCFVSEDRSLKDG
jgi:hypothetical protein